MIRFAGFLGWLALAVLVLFVARLQGTTAIAFVFVGFPSLALALTMYFVHRWREGAFQRTEASRFR